MDFKEFISSGDFLQSPNGDYIFDCHKVNAIIEEHEKQNIKLYGYTLQGNTSFYIVEGFKLANRQGYLLSKKHVPLNFDYVDYTFVYE